MPTLLRLEGPDLESLLERVRDEHGPQAKIVQADRVRTGGVAGFFAREHYEVAIEVDPSALAASSPVPSPTPGTAAPLPAAPLPAAPVISAPTSLLDLAEQVEQVEREQHVSVSRPPRDASISTEKPSFADVLAQLTRENGDQPRAAELFTPVQFEPAPSSPPEAGETPEILEPQVPAQRAVEARPVQPRVLERTAQPAPERNDAPPTPTGVLERIAHPLALPEQMEDLGQAERLLALGLPRGLVPDAAMQGIPVDLYSALVCTLRARLPQPPRPPVGDGEILVLLGPTARTLEVARAIATTARLDPDTAVLLAAPTPGADGPAGRRITGPADAARRARKLREADGGHIVVVDAPMDPDGARWAGAMAVALGAHAVWACVEASTKPGDVVDWIDRVGEVHALAVEGLAATRDPASVLGLYVPVALIDRRRATATAWSGLLCARIHGEAA